MLKDVPVVGVENDEGEPAAGEILLVGEVLVRGDHHVVASVFGGAEQVTVTESCPVLFSGSVDFVTL